MNPTIISLNDFADLVRSTDTIFGVTFVKKTDGSLRTMQARTSVRKGVKGVIPPEVRKSEDKRNRVLTVYDMVAFDKYGERGAFRRINLDGIVGCSFRGTRYVLNEETGMLEAANG